MLDQKQVKVLLMPGVLPASPETPVGQALPELPSSSPHGRPGVLVSLGPAVLTGAATPSPARAAMGSRGPAGRAPMGAAAAAASAGLGHSCISRLCALLPSLLQVWAFFPPLWISS